MIPKGCEDVSNNSIIVTTVAELPQSEDVTRDKLLAELNKLSKNLAHREMFDPEDITFVLAEDQAGTAAATVEYVDSMSWLILVRGAIRLGLMMADVWFQHEQISVKILEPVMGEADEHKAVDPE